MGYTQRERNDAQRESDIFIDAKMPLLGAILSWADMAHARRCEAVRAAGIYLHIYIYMCVLGAGQPIVSCPFGRRGAPLLLVPHVWVPARRRWELGHNATAAGDHLRHH